jgi:hypothetical protein
LIGYEIEIRGIPKNYLKIINNLIWGFIWNNKVNQVERNVCCMDIEEGGLEMINLFFHRGIMWPSLVKIQYTELKLSCGNLCGRPPYPIT